MSPGPVRVPSQQKFAPRITSVASYEKGDVVNLGLVHRSPGICLMAEKNPGKPQLGDILKAVRP